MVTSSAAALVQRCGLAIAETIVAAHDGNIEVETAPGAGANFRVLFQAAVVGPETRQWVRS